MTPATTPPPGAKPPRTAPAVLPPAQYETTWIGYEAALPWIRISPPLVRAPLQAR